MQANPLQIREMVYCVIRIHYLKEILLTMEYRLNELRRSGREELRKGFTVLKLVPINLFKLQFVLMLLFNSKLS